MGIRKYAMSALIFCFSTNTHIVVLREVKVVYQFGGLRGQVNHFLFKEDLNVYGQCKGNAVVKYGTKQSLSFLYQISFF